MFAPSNVSVLLPFSISCAPAPLRELAILIDWPALALSIRPALVLNVTANPEIAYDCALVAKVQLSVVIAPTLTVFCPVLAKTADVPAAVGATPGGLDQLVAVP